MNVKLNKQIKGKILIKQIKISLQIKSLKTVKKRLNEQAFLANILHSEEKSGPQ